MTLSADRIAGQSITTNKLFIDGDLNFGASGTRKNITNIGALYRNNSGYYPFIQMAVNSIYLQPETSGFAGALSRSGNAEVGVLAEDVEMKFEGNTILITGAATTGGQWDLGYINVKINGVARSFAIENPH